MNSFILKTLMLLFPVVFILLGCYHVQWVQTGIQESKGIPEYANDNHSENTFPQPFHCFLDGKCSHSIFHHHTVFADVDGMPRDPLDEPVNLSGYKELLFGNIVDVTSVMPNNDNQPSISEFSKYVKHILENADKWAEQNARGMNESNTMDQDNKKGPPTTKLLLYVNGGLTTKEDMFEMLCKQYNSITNDPTITDRHYPILLIWESDFLSSYWEHVTQVRRGIKGDKLNYLSAPLYLASDTVITIAKTPIVLWTDLMQLIRSTSGYVIETPATIILGARDVVDNVVPNANQDNVENRENDNDSASIYNYFDDGGNFNDIERWLEQEYNAAKNQYNVEIGNVSVSDFEKTVDYITYYPEIIKGFTVNPIAKGQHAKASWDIMLRRTNNMYRVAEDFDSKTLFNVASGKDAVELANQEIQELISRVLAGGQELKPNGAFARFFRILIQHMQEEINRCPEKSYEITLVGHSMGTIVINHILNDEELSEGLMLKYPNNKVKPAIENIVYMAAACSVKDLASTMVKYIAKTKRQMAANISSVSQEDFAGLDSVENFPHFYNLTLSTYSELHEHNWFRLAPQGSLLEWIDLHYHKPETFIHRTAGKERNIIPSVHLFHAVRDHATFKSFGRKEGSLPQKHGEFDNIPFWRKTSWYLSKKGGVPFFDQNWDSSQDQTSGR